MTIKAHCMGVEFPKRDTDSPSVFWLPATWDEFSERSHRVPMSEDLPSGSPNVRWESLKPEMVTKCRLTQLPSAADLDAVAEEQRVKEKTSAQVPNR